MQVILGRILIYRRRHDEAVRYLERALLLNPNDTDVLVHAALGQAYLGDPESALATATKAMRLNPGHPPWYAAPAGLALFMLGRDRECLDVVAAAPTRMFVDVAAFAAASAALSGDMTTAKSHLQDFLEDFRERIGFGRAAEPGEPLRWLLQSIRSGAMRMEHAWHVVWPSPGWRPTRTTGGLRLSPARLRPRSRQRRFGAMDLYGRWRSAEFRCSFRTRRVFWISRS